MEIDAVTLSPNLLRVYAAGYTDALTDTQPELDTLRLTLRQTCQELEQERARADQIYHDAYCGCRKRITQEVLTGLNIREARERSNDGTEQGSTASI